MSMVHSVTAEMAVRDAHSYADYLLSLPETTAAPIGTTGYCMGGRLSLTVAGALGERVAAAASIHGGNIAAADDPDSPHHRANSISATVYVAGATDDASFPDEQRDRLARALSDASVNHTIETYPAAHGFAVPDNATYDPDAAARHWRALADLYAAALR
jgi:carboxymethylenebutenolidase